jgi:ribonucleoside-triphosphate reductase
VKGLHETSSGKLPDAIIIEDSREGWVHSLKELLEVSEQDQVGFSVCVGAKHILPLQAHFYGKPHPKFDFSKIRPRGEPIKGFGGTASGPEILKRLHDDVNSALSPLAGKVITVTAIVDIMNMIGRCGRLISWIEHGLRIHAFA